jgi:AcrR family transcriptional regulator
MNDKKAQLVHRRKEQILAAAKSIFAQNGFRRTKIEQISDSLSVGKGTIYRYFSDKKSLFLTVFEQGIDRLMKIVSGKTEPITDPREKLVAATRTYFEFFDNDRELIEILMQVRSEFKEDYHRIFLAMYSKYIAKIQENLQTGIQLGIFRELDIEKTAEAISSLLQGVLQSFYVRKLGGESIVYNIEKEIQADSDSVKTNFAVSHPKQQKERLTDRTEAVTALLLDGLLKRR